MKACTVTVPVSVETRFLGGARSEIEIQLPLGDITVADLVRAKVTAEWNAGVAVGRESIPPDTPFADWPSLEDAIRNALDAYRAGWYVLRINGEQPGGLDTEYTLGPDSSVVFIRLYPLMDG